MDPELYDEILASVRGRIWKQHTWLREPLEEGLALAVTLRHLVAGVVLQTFRLQTFPPEGLQHCIPPPPGRSATLQTFPRKI